MTPEKPPDTRNQADMFRSPLDNILNTRHPLFKLAGKIERSVFEREFGSLYVEKVGRPGLPIRLLVGLHYLKHTYRESDESVVEKFLENPCWQYFCGFEYFQHHFPLDPSTLVRWRKRVGPKGMEKLFQETIVAAQRENLLRRSDVSRAIVDTTVQENAIAFPTDARLYHKARRTLVRAATREGIALRQNYELLGKKAFLRHSRYARSRQGKRAKRETRKLKTFLGRVIRDLQRKRPTPSPRWLKRRAAIEPIISHLKSDNGMDRNHLKGKDGDRVNAILAGCGSNLRKLLRSFLAFIFQWLFGHRFQPEDRFLPLSFGLKAWITELVVSHLGSEDLKTERERSGLKLYANGLEPARQGNWGNFE